MSSEQGGPAHAGGLLTVDLDAIVANWRLLKGKLANGHCAAVVKADGYGLGAVPVSRALAAAGCREFFVAHLDEAITVRAALPDADLAVLGSVVAGAEAEYSRHRIRPVLNHLGDLEAWARFARANEAPPALLHVDTGMARLGLSEPEVDRLAAEPERLDRVRIAYVMSHLACADEKDHPLNPEQLARFRSARERLPVRAPASFANSSGIFLGPGYHFDLGRPGVALYGVNPTPDAPNPMRPVVRLQGRILQVRDVDTHTTVGYGASQRIEPPAKLATISVGYADGFLRSLSHRGSARIGGVPAPFVGRVSMDLIVVDVSDAAPELARAGGWVDLIGPDRSVDEVAAEAGTIGYEILTSLGRRYRRTYVGGDARPA